MANYKEVLRKSMDLIDKQNKVIDEYEKALDKQWQGKLNNTPIGEPSSYSYKEEALFLYLSDNPMIVDLIESLPDGVKPNQITLKNLRVSVKPHYEYSEIYKDSMGITRDEIIPRSKSLKRKDKELKHFTRIHKEMYID